MKTNILSLSIQTWGNKMGRFLEIIKVPEGALAWIYLFSENQITEVSLHWHHSMELTLITQGEARYTINGIRRTVKKGDLVLINSGDLHGCSVKPDACEAINIMFPNSFLSQFAKNCDTPLFRLDNTKVEYTALAGLCEKLYRVFSERTKDRYAQLIVNSVICDIAYLLLSSFRWDEFMPQSIESEKYRERCSELVKYVDGHFRENITVESVSNAFCISKEHLARIFRDQMGTTFKKHLTRVRMYHAYKMLAGSDYTLIQIAMECGFPDSRALIASFKKVYGITPSRYRKEFYQNVHADFHNAKRMDFFLEE